MMDSIAAYQWAIDAFYEGYNKANAEFKAANFTGLKPIIGGIISLLAHRDSMLSSPEMVERVTEAIQNMPTRSGGYTDFHSVAFAALQAIKEGLKCSN